MPGTNPAVAIRCDGGSRLPSVCSLWRSLRSGSQRRRLLRPTVRCLGCVRVSCGRFPGVQAWLGVVAFGLGSGVGDGWSVVGGEQTVHGGVDFVSGIVRVRFSVAQVAVAFFEMPADGGSPASQWILAVLASPADVPFGIGQPLVSGSLRQLSGGHPAQQTLDGVVVGLQGLGRLPGVSRAWISAANAIIRSARPGLAGAGGNGGVGPKGISGSAGIGIRS